ncbi:MAG: family 16 glycosylhydrolase [Bacteroidota bacterium]|nr:family 16 glycosylhydrolase [Bacteroidota bacterium]
MKKMLFGLSILASLGFSCSKKTDGSGSAASTAPSNLTLTGTVRPDSSGNVDFAAHATNAAVYTFDFGNSVTQVSATGTLTYKYPVSGVYTVTVVAKSASGQTLSQSITLSVSVVLKLVWSDEFDAAGAPDPSKWGYDLGTGNGWGNNELEYYTNRSDNVTVSGGTLQIIAKRENYNGSAFTSARLLTKGKYSFKYGRIDVRAKLPEGVGTWPAIWMLGDNIATAGWPACGEVDIMEHVGKRLNVIYGTLHHPGHSGANGDGSTTTVSTATSAFHIYSTEWNANTIRFLVDGSPFYTFSNNSSLPFNQSFFIILNIAMGGDFGGAVDPAFTSGTMEVDYVRVYQ